MANVYTKKSKFPRTVTLRDLASVYQLENPVPRRPHCLSPTRRGNPHPSGLLHQDPYNRDDALFSLWDPDTSQRNTRMTITLPHIQKTNFTCGTYLTAKEGDNRKPPDVKYSLDSTQRTHFDQPRPLSGFLSHYKQVMRFSYTPRDAAIGIIPTSLPPINGASVKESTPAKKETELEAS